MMETDKLDSKQRCQAMIDAGIKDPMRQEGIDFCVQSCPYEYCIVLEKRTTSAQLKKIEDTETARSLRVHKVSINDIALILNIKRSKVRDYTRQDRKPVHIKYQAFGMFEEGYKPVDAEVQNLIPNTHTRVSYYREWDRLKQR